jgi:CheY-like chemotaxis protein
MAETTDPPVALLLCDDLMWVSRISSTGQALGYRILGAPSVEKLEALARREQPRWIILDLATSKSSAAEVVSRLRAASGASPRFTAFGSHVDTATLQAARDAGCDPVLTRSQMAESLPELLKQWLG